MTLHLLVKGGCTHQHIAENCPVQRCPRFSAPHKLHRLTAPSQATLL